MVDAVLVAGITSIILILATGGLIGYVYHVKKEDDRKNRRRKSRSGGR